MIKTLSAYQRRMSFSKLETNKKQLILNATKHANEESTPKDPTEFCKSFLLKTTVFWAKDTLQQAIKTSKEIVFFPSMAFTSKLYTVDLIWHSPDSPTGISVFYCTESSDLDSDQGYALLDKIERSDIQKASKQTLEVPNNYSVALWMIKKPQGCC